MPNLTSAAVENAGEYLVCLEDPLDDDVIDEGATGATGPGPNDNSKSRIGTTAGDRRALVMAGLPLVTENGDGEEGEAAARAARRVCRLCRSGFWSIQNKYLHKM